MRVSLAMAALVAGIAGSLAPAAHAVCQEVPHTLAKVCVADPGCVALVQVNPTARVTFECPSS